VKRKVYTIPFGADFIEELGNFILSREEDLSRCAVVFAGKRPALYLRAKLARHRTAPFYSPRFFSMEEFVAYAAERRSTGFTDLDPIDAIWLLYQSVRSLRVFQGHPLARQGFGEFFYWGRYLLDFINQLDMENVASRALHGLEKNAEIGYDIPHSVNELLMNISILREEFHRVLKEQRSFTRGYRYLRSLEEMDRAPFDEFDHMYFAGLFGLTGTEREIVRKLWDHGKADLVLEGDVEEWKILKDLLAYLGGEVHTLPCHVIGERTIRFYSGFDTHAEALKAHQILQSDHGKRTALVLPTSDSLLPVLTFAVDRVATRYNVSLGYPLSRTPVFDLIRAVLDAQSARRGGAHYPAQEYLAVVLHPFVKNMESEIDVRILLRDIEERVTGQSPEKDGAGLPYVMLEEMEGSVAGRPRGSTEAIRLIHRLFLKGFEYATTPYECAVGLENMLDHVLSNTPVRSYVLSGEIFAEVFDRLGRIKDARFSREVFHEDRERNKIVLFDFVKEILRSATLPFDTHPVEPLEIIGVLESRNISFDTVIVLDVNEGTMPRPKKVDPLVPLGVYDKLGIPSPEYNEELYRYYFYRLINGAKNVHLIYIDSADAPRSRYMEQILWEEEKKRKQIGAIPVEKSLYRINLRPREGLPLVEKTDSVSKLLMERQYSPSDIDTYLLCPLAFYYGRILKFEERRDISDDIDAMERGTIIHRILFRTFQPFLGLVLAPLRYDEVMRHLERAVEDEFRHRVENGEYYLFKQLTRYKLESFLQRTLRDAERPCVLLDLEKDLKGSIDVHRKSVAFGGRVDRIDRYPEEEGYMVIDYKTGGSKKYPRGLVARTRFDSIEDLHSNVETLQLPIYVHLFQQLSGVPLDHVNARLILLKNNDEELLFKERGEGKREEVQALYVEGVRTVLKHILDPEQPFRPFDGEACDACAFTPLCHV
jgi:ATP-dependent helicase/nuclease subunit B